MSTEKFREKKMTGARNNDFQTTSDQQREQTACDEKQAEMSSVGSLQRVIIIEKQENKRSKGHVGSADLPVELQISVTFLGGAIASTKTKSNTPPTEQRGESNDDKFMKHRRPERDKERKKKEGNEGTGRKRIAAVWEMWSPYPQSRLDRGVI